jgi:hypothetical protein
MILIRKHSGRSGISVYGWRVYRVSTTTGIERKFQLGKFRSREEAQRAAEHYRSLDRQLDAVNAARKGFSNAFTAEEGQ